MEIIKNRFLKGIEVVLSIGLVIGLMGCAQKTDVVIRRLPDHFLFA